MYSPFTLDFGNIDFWSTSLPPMSGPPVSQLWWLKGIFASLFNCLLGPNFSSQTVFIWFCWKHENSSGHFFVTCTQNWGPDWPMSIFEVFTSGLIPLWLVCGWITFELLPIQSTHCSSFPDIILAQAVCCSNNQDIQKRLRNYFPFLSLYIMLAVQCSVGFLTVFCYLMIFKREIIESSNRKGHTDTSEYCDFNL